MWKVPGCLLVWTVNCENAFDNLLMHTSRKKVPKYTNEAVIKLIRRTLKVHNFALIKFLEVKFRASRESLVNLFECF